MFEPFKYLWKTISQQITDQVTIVRQIIQYYREQLSLSLKTREKVATLKGIMTKAPTYKKWKAVSEAYDQLPVIQQQTNEVYSPYYDYQYLQQLVRCMSEARAQKDPMKLIEIIRSHSDRNVANHNSPFLYRHAYNRSKRLIEHYQRQLTADFETIIKADISQSKKIQFFGEVRHAVGRSALLLSGGAIMGMYHIGVVQALIEADCLPKIIAGSSAGSIIASIIATHSREEIMEGKTFDFKAFANQKPFSIFQTFRRVGRQGSALDIKVLERFLRDNIGQYTFQEAYDKFGVILNITVTGVSQYDADRLLNYLTAPNVLIWSASTASCAIPYVYGATDLYCKDHNGKISKYTLMNRKFLDGSIGHDLPMEKLSILFNVNNFIVSQTNPWVIPFMDYTQDFKGLQSPLLFPLIILIHKIKEFTLGQLKHRASQIAFLFPNAVTKFFNLLTQSYVGDITIWPKPKLSDYLRILENPTSYEAIMCFVHGGRQRTYPKIHHIKATMFMQKQIERCYKHIRNSSRLHFIRTLSLREIQDAGEEQFVMKKVFEDAKEWEEDQDDSPSTENVPESPKKATRTKIKPMLSLHNQVSRTVDEQNPSPKRKPAQLNRNESYLLPRQKSFM